MTRRLLLALFSLIGTSQLLAQPLGVGYYDLDALYDTAESPFYNDTPYTAEGSKKWNNERYARKISNTAALIDSMALPIVGLFGVENQEVLRDIIRHSQQDYSSVHRTRNSLDGLDFALLYYGDQLFVESVETMRDMLIIDCTLSDESPLMIILSRNGEDTAEYLEDLQPTQMVLVMGKITSRQIRKMNYTNLFAQHEAQGQGNYGIYRGYVMHDRIATNKNEKILKSGIYITPWLLNHDKQRALATYHKDIYEGGFSNFLPIFTYITK